MIGAPARSSDTDVSDFRGANTMPESTPNVDEMTDAQVQRALLKELFALRTRHEALEAFADRLAAVEEAQNARAEWMNWREETDKRLENGRLHFGQLEGPLRAMAEALKDFFHTRGRDDLAQRIEDSMPPPSIEVTEEEFRDEPTSPGQ